ncbi:MAG: patatin-like phospholipase family protein [Chloroflexota bacterium]
MATRALVLAGGGIAGIAWESGVLEGLHEAGVDTSRWDLVVGTSAGSFVGARLLGDGSPEPLYRLQTRSPSSEEEAALKRLFGGSFWLAVTLARRRRLAWVGLVWLVSVMVTALVRFAAHRGVKRTFQLASSMRKARSDPNAAQAIAAVVGAVAEMTPRRRERELGNYWSDALESVRDWPPTRLVTTAIDIKDGSRQTFDSSSNVTLSTAIAASACLPGLLPPVRINGGRYIDGGLGSSANADLASGFDEIWILSPFEATSLDAEVERLAAGGAEVHLITAGDRRDLGLGIAVMDPAGRVAAARAGYRLGLAIDRN